MLAGCADAASNGESVPASSSDVITLDWYVNYSWFVTDWGENMVSQKFTKDTGVDINFITPMGNETNKLESLIDSDSLPDIVTIPVTV